MEYFIKTHPFVKRGIGINLKVLGKMLGPIKVITEIILFTAVIFYLCCNTTFASGNNTNFSQMMQKNAKSDVEKFLEKIEQVDFEIKGDLNFIKTTKVTDVGWGPNYQKQQQIYNNSKQNGNNYFFMLSTYILEGSKNNPRAIHYNSNGTYDRGDYQINDCCLYLLEQLGYEKDPELLFDSDINQRCANRKIRQDRKNYKNVTNYFTAFFNYTGGNTTLTDFLENGLDLSNERMVRAYIYSVKGIEYMVKLYQLYHGLI